MLASKSMPTCKAACPTSSSLPVMCMVSARPAVSAAAPMDPSAPATPPEAKPESCSPAMSMALLKLDMSKSMYAMIVPALIFMPMLIRLTSFAA